MARPAARRTTLRAVGGRHVSRHRVGPVRLRQRTLHDLGDVCVGDLLDRWRDADGRVQSSDRGDETQRERPGVLALGVLATWPEPAGVRASSAIRDAAPST